MNYFVCSLHGRTFFNSKLRLKLFQSIRVFALWSVCPAAHNIYTNTMLCYSFVPLLHSFFLCVLFGVHRMLFCHFIFFVYFTQFFVFNPLFAFQFLSRVSWFVAAIERRVDGGAAWMWKGMGRRATQNLYANEKEEVGIEFNNGYDVHCCPNY